MHRSICAHVRMHMHMHIVYVQGVYMLKLYAYIHFTLGPTNANPNNNSNTGLQSAPWGCCFRRGGTQTMFPQHSCNIKLPFMDQTFSIIPLSNHDVIWCFFWGATLEPFLFGMRWPNDNIFHACASSATQRKSPTQSQVKIVICFQVATLWSLKTWRVHLSHPQAIPTSQPNGCLSAKALWAGVRPWRWLRWNLEGLQLGGSGSWEMGKHGMNKTKCWWTYLRILGNVNEIWAYNEPSYDNTTMVIMLAKKMQRTMLGKSHPVFSTSRTFWGFPQSQKIDDAILEAAPTLTPLNGQMAMGHASYIQSAGSTGAGAGFQINTVSDGFSVYHYRLFQKNSESLH